MREKEKVPLRVKGLVTKVSIRVEVLFEGGYASRWVGSCEEEGMVKDGGGGISGETQREEGKEVEGKEVEVEGKEGTGAEREEASASGTRCSS